jgi:UbiD family decarboxylase
MAMSRRSEARDSKNNSNNSSDKSKWAPSPDLRQFLNLLDKSHEILHIRKRVKPKFEIAALTSRLESKQAVLFENVESSKMKLVSNLVGTPSRFLLGIGGQINSSTNVRQSIREQMARILTSLVPPSAKNTRPVFEDNKSHSLAGLPIVTHFEKDAGPFVTSSIVFARDQERGNQNSSTHRLLPISENRMAIRMVEGRHLHKCFTYAKEHGEDLKVAIVIGVHPAISVAAAYQAAYGIDEMHIANSILNNQLTLSTLNQTGLRIPSGCEIVLEGKILADVSHEEWMVEMLRTYDFKRKQPVFELDTMLYRENPIYHDILPGFAEHRLLMGLPVEAKIYEQVKNAVPNTISVHLTDGGCNWLSAVIQIRKRLEGEPKNAMLAAFSAHPSLKMATVVDEDIDPFDPVAVEYALSTRFQADSNMIMIPRAKGSSLDPSSDQTNLLTTKLGIDATASILKPKERFEIAKIPTEEDIVVNDYLK